LGAGAEEQEQSTFLELRADFEGVYRAGLGSKPEVFTSVILYDLRMLFSAASGAVLSWPIHDSAIGHFP
jgi:hypothetical protein